jgi:hypothetical protein
MKKQIPLIIAAIIVIAILFVYLWMPGTVTKGNKTTETPSVNSTSALNKTTFYLKFFPAEIQNEVQFLAEVYSLDITYWGFDPINNEINLYDYGIQNESVLKELRGKKIGDYTIHVMNGTEILNTQDEVQNQLFQLRKDPKNQISHISMITDPLNNPPRYYAEIVCFNSTPENRKLDNMVIKGWRIQVFVCCAVPSSTGNSSKSGTTPKNSSVIISPNFTDINSSPYNLPPGVKQDIMKISHDYIFNINKWEFDPTNKEAINLYAIYIRNESEIEKLQGKRIGNYTIHIIHDTEFETTQSEVAAYFNDLMKNPDYQIAHTGIGINTMVDPPERFAELWVYKSTPANKNLDNTVIKGFKIIVRPMAPPPTEPTLNTRSSNASS